MTLAPSTDFGIRGVKGKRQDVNWTCAAPGCQRLSIHVHHMWSRSFLRGQPYDWISTSDGTVIGNRVGLCVEHHDMVTGMVGGHRAKIHFRGGLFYWEERDPASTGWRECGLLSWQPPGATVEAAPDGSSREEETSEVCPTCGKPKHAKPHKPDKPRKTRDWTLTVPDDVENGAEILDGWADDLAEILGFADASSRLRRYHAVATALMWTVQHRQEFVDDLVEASQ